MGKAVDHMHSSPASPHAFPAVGRLRRFLGVANPVGRGLVLFVALVAFTLIYAYVLQRLSESGDAPAGDQSTAMAPPAAVNRPAVVTQPVVARPQPTAAAAAPAVRQVAGAPAAASYLTVDDALPGAGGERFTYVGQWEHLSGIHDGRSEGTSSRTYHVGATAAFQFTGTHLKLFGVRGPGGGYAELRIDGQTYGLLRFYAPRKEAGVLVYASPALPSGAHDVEIIVAQAPNGLPKRRFVNLDGAAYAGR